MTTNQITVETLEALANELHAEGEAARAKLVRLVRAYARILAAREPERFTPRAMEYADEDGHYDNTFPPDQVYRCYTGPTLLKVRGAKTRDVATEGGFYHEWKRVTEAAGLYAAPDGGIWGCDHTGTGRVGQFAAHPGDCGVLVELTWERRSDASVSLAELLELEESLRELAFPLSAEVAA